MAKYKLTQPFFGVANRNPHAQHHKAGAIIETDAPPSRNWIPLDDAAHAAIAKQDRKFDIMPNGVQARFRATGQLTGGAGAPKNPQPVPALTPQHHTAADHVAASQAIFVGKELPEVHGADIATGPLRRALERNRNR